MKFSGLAITNEYCALYIALNARTLSPDHHELSAMRPATPDMKNRIMQAVNAGFDAQTALLADLVRIPSQRGSESRAQDFMANTYRQRGYTVDRWKINVDEIKNMRGFSPVMVSYDDAWNVVGAHRSRTRTGRSLILNGHIDVVPTGPLDEWTHDPYDPVINDGWMNGRGAGDMKSGLLACLAAMDALRAIGMQPAADVFQQSVVEEECTGNGALACLQRGYRADLAFIPEPFTPKLMRAQVGPLWFQVHVKGDPQHASGAMSGAGTNAIEKAIEVIQALSSLETLWNARKVDHKHFCDHPHPIRFNLGKISGGDWPSSVPAWCVFDMRVAVYPGQNPADACAEIERFIAAFAERDPFLSRHPPKIVYHGYLAEGYVLENAEEAEAVLRSSHETVFGEPLQEHVTSAATDGRFYGLYADTPAIVYGPESRLIHGYNEAVNLESVRQMTQSLALFIADWCGLESV